MVQLQLPHRYEPIARLGRGGGGEVWAVRDRLCNTSYALKILGEGASEREMAALVREAAALSGLEGLGVPRVMRFGLLPASGRPYLVRELIEGRSLEDLIAQGVDLTRTLDALCRSADQLTVLHRAGLLHGDVKPANVIVESDGSATLVDLGLAAPLKEGGTTAEGLTPRYAAPELFAGKPLTVRAEVYALGAALEQALEQVATVPAGVALDDLYAVAARATADNPGDRYPSADEFASELRRAAKLTRRESFDGVLWPVVGIEAVSAKLLDATAALAPGTALCVVGPKGSGRTVLLRRLSWSLGISGQAVAWIDELASGSPEALAAELTEHESKQGVTILVDDADALPEASQRQLQRALEQGGRVIAAAENSGRPFASARTFLVPPLDETAACELVRRAVPSLTEPLVKRVVEVAEGRPGELRRLLGLIARLPVVSGDDIDRVFRGSGPPAEGSSRDPLERAEFFLDRGRYIEARGALVQLEGLAATELSAQVAWARLELGLGDAAAARVRLSSLSDDVRARAADADRELARLVLARAQIGVGNYADALTITESLLELPGGLGVEARVYHGLALSFSGRHEQARAELERAVRNAEELDAARVLGVALVSLGLALQRNDAIEEAQAAYQRTLIAAEKASDAATLATAQLNLAGLLKMSGDIAGAIEHFEAAADMGRRSGREYTTRNALLNLANTDLYLGRLARARESIDSLQAQREQLPPVARAQLLGLSAELAARSGQNERAEQLYEACAAAYVELGRSMDAAEARLESVLLAARSSHSDPAELRKTVESVARELGTETAHRPLLLLAKARVEMVARNDAGSAAAIEEALRAARAAGQKEWIWRALEARAELEESSGQPFSARRDREEALSILETISARLPRDLREVYWNDPRRRQLRESVAHQVGVAATEHSPLNLSLPPAPPAGLRSSITTMTSTPLEQRLARILEVNSELALEHDLERLTARVTDYAVELLRAERGYVILRHSDGSLTVHASRSRAGDEPHAQFSRSIAEEVIKTGQPLVSVSAPDDARIRGFASVHQLMLRSVACVPVLSPDAAAIGALYVETRLRPGANFERELPMLTAFADQVAIAIENARLISENKRRADELAAANGELQLAQQRLQELLGDRTEQLKRTRQKLRETRDTLYGHFGYQGLVGTSAAMRRVYSLIERIKDTAVPVLITGESGTGKEVAARAIHNASDRAKRKFLGVNCGAIPEHLLESELFGNVRGAYTGADRERKGLFREAEGGTILLDEIGEMPHKMQSGLLRVLQDRCVRPVGGSQEEPVDVRVIFATNRDLEAMVREGKFREDLYYRIHVVELKLPPLRERTEDIAPLVDHFLGIFAARYKREKKTVTREALRRLAKYEWPGNVRQLEHVLLNAWVLSDEPELEADEFDLPNEGGGHPTRVSERVAPPPSSGTPRSQPKPATPKRQAKSSLSQHRLDERERILKALEASNWNRVKAAELSGIPRRTFYRRLREYGIQ